MWQLQKISFILILREIKVSEFKDSKTTILAHLEAHKIAKRQFLNF